MRVMETGDLGHSLTASVQSLEKFPSRSSAVNANHRDYHPPLYLSATHVGQRSQVKPVLSKFAVSNKGQCKHIDCFGV